jgi:outer membrane biosynthesis protein TonB
MNTTTPNHNDHRQQELDVMQPLTEFYIYEDLNLVCNRLFNKDHITIGSSRDADLCLEHKAVEQFHAVVHYRDNQVLLTNNYPQNGLLLNGRTVGLAELQHEDVIDIGPFSLKIKMTAAKSPGKIEQNASHAVRLINRYSTPQSMQSAARHLAKMLNADVDRVLPLVAKNHHILKKGLTGFKAAQIQNALLKAGVVCDVQTDAPQPSADPAPAPVEKKAPSPAAPQPAKAKAAHLPPRTVKRVPEPVSPVTSRAPSKPKPAAAVVSPAPSKPKSVAATASSEPLTPESADYVIYEANTLPAKAADVDAKRPAPVPKVSFTEIFEDANDDGEDDIWEASFSLKRDLGRTAPKDKNLRHLPEKEQLRIVKTIGASVIDVCYLEGRQRYTIDTGQGPFHLVEAKPKGDSCINILPSFRGYSQRPSGEINADLDSYKIPDLLNIKNRAVYRIPFPKTDITVIEADGCSYRMARVMRHSSPEVKVVESPSEFSWRHWATSGGVHLLIVLCLSIWAYFQAVAPEPAKPHFVRIDPSMLAKLEPPEPKVQPKPKEPPKPEPVRAAEKVKKTPKKKPPKKKPPKTKKPQVKIAKKGSPRKKVPRTGSARRHPKAGGGFGKGTIKNRNINQTGILSVLGSSSMTGPSQAIAAVTNLDAVAVPGAAEKQFSVGGLKGSLGNGKISVATGGAIMQTKGSKQVLRSAGARGKGSVAALERGTTGKKKVQAMVTAKLSRTVKIEGGMSREMVKRVIDRHLEEITVCYETALMSNPNILGRMVFEWKIMMNGRVGSVRIVASSVNSHEIHNCIKTAIKSWQFPKPVGSEVVVSYPFVFDLVSF